MSNIFPYYNFTKILNRYHFTLRKIEQATVIAFDHEIYACLFSFPQKIFVEESYRGVRFFNDLEELLRVDLEVREDASLQNGVDAIMQEWREWLAYASPQKEVIITDMGKKKAYIRILTIKNNLAMTLRFVLHQGPLFLNL